MCHEPKKVQMYISFACVYFLYRNKDLLVLYLKLFSHCSNPNPHDETQSALLKPSSSWWHMTCLRTMFVKNSRYTKENFDWFCLINIWLADNAAACTSRWRFEIIVEITTKILMFFLWSKCHLWELYKHCLL